MRKRVYTEAQDQFAFWSAIAVILTIILIPIVVGAGSETPERVSAEVTVKHWREVDRSMNERRRRIDRARINKEKRIEE